MEQLAIPPIGKHQPVVAGLFLGMGIGSALAVVLGFPFTLGQGLGMFVGITIGIALDRNHPKRSRILWMSFALTVLLVAVFAAASNMSDV
ncbi:hypothetical protein [Massilia sp. SYSU DXS3249]